MPKANDPQPRRIRTRRDFAHELTLLRERAGLTVRQVAAAVGVQGAHSTIGDWFAGRGLPSTTSRELLIQVLRACGEDDRARIDDWLTGWRQARHRRGSRLSGPEPYRGLAPFQPEDADWFFGRSDLTARLIARVTELRERGGGIQVLVGPSGSGKSSLIGAGLLATLGTGTIRTPGVRPADALAGVAGPLIVLDQFEELFTLCQEEGERRAFVTAVHALARDNIVVLGLRSDFYTQALSHPELVAAITEGQLTVGPMDEAGLRAAIAEPARKAGLDLEAGLIDLILRDLTPAAGALPLLSHALYATWRHGHGPALTVADYHAVGGIGGAIAVSADTAYAELTQPQRTPARRLLLQLVHVAEDTADTRRRVARQHLPAGAEDVLGRFIAQRLLTADDGTVEISHEALLTAWPLLRSWLAEDRAGLLAGRRLAEDAAAWDHEGRDPASLYRGTRLAAAQEWSATTDHPPGALATEFLDASTALEHRQAAAARAGARRLRRLVAGLVVLLVLACLSGIAALDAAATAREQRDIALSRQVAQQASAVRAADPALAARLAQAAYALAPTMEARGGLLSAFGVPFNIRVSGHTDYVHDVEYAPGGRILASASKDRTVRLWDMATPHRPRPLAVLAGHTGEVTALAFTPDGRRLAGAGDDGTIRLWDVATARPLTTLPGRGGAVRGLAFTPDGRLLASGNAEGTIFLRDVATGRPLATLHGHQSAVRRLAVHGQILASAGHDGTARLWDLTRFRLLSTLTGHTGRVLSVAFSPDGQHLVTAGEDSTPRLWDLADPRRPRLQARLSGHRWVVNGAVFAPDGRTVATAGDDNTARVWDAFDGRQLQVLSPRPGAPIDTGAMSDVAFSPDGRTLATSSYDHLLRLWDFPGVALMGGARTRPIWGTPDGRTVVTGNGDRALRWDVGDPHRPVSRVLTATEGLVKLSADGSLMVTAGPGGGIRLWSLIGAAPRLLATMNGAATPPDSAEFSADRRVLAVTATRDYVIRIWDISDPAHPRETKPLAGHTGFVNAIAFAPSQRLLASFGYDRTARLWDLTDPSRPASVAVLRGHGNAVYNGAFSPDATTLATAGQDTTVRLWDVTHPRRPTSLAVLDGHGNYVDSLAFSGDGRLLATGGGEPIVHLWDVADPRAPTRWAILTGGDGPVVGLMFAGRLLVSGGADRPARLWSTDPTLVDTAVCARAYPDLTNKQWASYFPGVDHQTQCH
ncbi:helix-turn-helix domain-containing protein [Streptosporangium sp. NBC_01755]|uniref:nSTAND1 domain-containing NTPase n=1 Tax=Streptosporangium sp. NBC_01755 TaxID=2975949 RepID=UPI002DDA7D33|nr:helix-turn-helix domain-containing protein [Streptosporangium sp. NBC_01755]WSC99870.1 helix-turn-helix domain-containing protein [Streptosporangium sp. NBC_01755]